MSTVKTLVAQILANADAYHKRAIDHEAFSERAHALWAEAIAADLNFEVSEAIVSAQQAAATSVAPALSPIMQAVADTCRQYEAAWRKQEAREILDLPDDYEDEDGLFEAFFG